LLIARTTAERRGTFISSNGTAACGKGFDQLLVICAGQPIVSRAMRNATTAERFLRRRINSPTGRFPPSPRAAGENGAQSAGRWLRPYFLQMSFIKRRTLHCGILRVSCPELPGSVGVHAQEPPK
jgi:hypothetical protein